MEPSPLEATVRDRFRQRYEPMVGRSPRFTPELVATLSERHVADLLPILRERFADADVPTEDDLHQAEMERSERSIQRMVGVMRAPSTLARLAKNPRKLGIVLALAKNAVVDLAALRTLRHDPTEEKLEAVARGISDRMNALTDKIKTLPPDDSGGPAPE